MKPTENEGEAPGRAALVLLCLAALALIAYAPILGGGYQFLNVDDDEYVTANPQVQAGLTPASLWWALTAYHSHNWHPLTWMSLQLDWQLYGNKPLGYHVTNVLIHTANTVLLFLVLRSLTGTLWRSATVAAFFAVHPLHIESVAWVAERKDVLSTLFWMLTLWAYAAYAVRPGWGRYLLTLTLFALGLMAKPMLVSLPCVLLLLDYWPLGRLDTGQGGIRPLLISGWWLLMEKLPFFALVGGASVLTLQAQQDIMQPLEFLPMSYRLANVPVAYLAYIGKMFWPMHLTVFYPHPGPSLSLGVALAAAGLLLVLTALTLWQARQRPYLAVGWLWYLGTLVPVIGVVQVGRQAYADRYTYIPLIGLFLLLAWGTYDLLGRRRRLVRTPAVVAGGLLAGCLLLTWRQLPTWRDDEVLWHHAMTVIPSGIAHQGMAKAWEKQGNIDKARIEYLEAVRSDPTPVAHNNVGVFLARHGWSDEALEHFAQALALYPDYAQAYFNRGHILLEQGKLDEAQQHLTEAVRLDPDFTTGHYYLGLVLERQGKFREAEAELTQALRGNPGSANARYHLGVVLEGQGRSREAKSYFLSALKVDPKHVEAHTSLGALLAREGQREAGWGHFLTALSGDPRNGHACFNLGLVLELDEQFAEACERFGSVIAGDSHDAEAHHHLGTALSRLGKLEEAQRHLDEAARLRTRSTASGGSPGLALDRPPREQFRVLPPGVPSR
ncbi:MAG TPA: tetratricopeptide repeat protein [Gemmataceae bacterium]|nr:tetratricopeptide repeat protein [Gemmataceae bacterium]